MFQPIRTQSYNRIAKVTEESPRVPICHRVTGVSGKRYTRLALMAEGGFGWVLKGRDADGGEIVVKLAKPTREKTLWRELGVNRLAVPRHEGFAELIDWGILRRKHPFLVFRSVAGVTLEEAAITSLPEVLRLIELVGESLTPLHTVGMVHGDLSPRNILLRADGTPVLIDFGLATRRGEQKRGETAGYTAPEGELDSLSDLYALGKVCERLLTALPQAERQRWDDSEAGRKVLQQATDEAPSQRPRSLGEFCEKLRELRKEFSLPHSKEVTIATCVEADHQEREEAWREFQRIDDAFPEFVCSTEESESSPQRARELLRLSLTEVQRAAELIERWRFDECPELQDRRRVSDFCNKYAKHLLPRGRVVEAARFGSASIKILHGLGSDQTADQLEVSRRLNMHSWLFGMVGNPLDTVCALVRSYAIRKRVEPSDSPLLPQSLNNLSNSLNEEIHQPTVAMLLEAKRLWRNTFGDFSNDVAWANSNLGRILSIAGQHDAAKLLTEKALFVKRQLLGERHPQVATVALNRAEQLCRERRFTEAEPYFQLTISIRKEWQEATSSNTMQAVVAWSKAAMDAGDFSRAYHLIKEHSPPEIDQLTSPECRTIRRQLAECCLRLKKKAEHCVAEMFVRADEQFFGEPLTRIVSHRAVFQRVWRWLQELNAESVVEDVAAMVHRDVSHLMARKRLYPLDLLEA